MIRRSVREWDYIAFEEPQLGAFTRDQADRLVEIARTTHLGGHDGERILINHPKRLRAQQVVGVLAAPGVSLEILPKIEGEGGDNAIRQRLIHMLADVYDLKIAEGNATELGWQSHDLLEILLRMFVDHLLEAVRRGLPRRYVDHADDLFALRGRLDAKRQFTVLAATPQKLACRYEELSPDIPLNQIMKAAVRRLLQIARAAENQRRLTELSFAFADVTDVPVKELPWHAVVLDRTNQEWARLLGFAKLLLGQRFQTTSAGGIEGFSLLFEMNTLFEEFVGRATNRALAGTHYQVRLQGPQNFALTEQDTGRQRFVTKPDIVVLAGGKPELIIDTKWKRLKGVIDDPKQGVSQADVYQMMAYAQVYGCPRIMLLYPHHKGLGQDPGEISIHHVAGGGDTQICAATLSLESPKLASQELRKLLVSGFASLDAHHAFAA